MAYTQDHHSSPGEQPKLDKLERAVIALNNAENEVNYWFYIGPHSCQDALPEACKRAAKAKARVEKIIDKRLARWNRDLDPEAF